MLTKPLNEFWKSSFIQVFVLICVAIMVIGCADSEDDISESPPNDLYSSDDPGDRFLGSIDIDWHIENEQGIEGAPEYESGNPPYQMELRSASCFYADTEHGRVHGAVSLPNEWTYASFVRELQLILTMTDRREATGRTRLYQSGSVELYHVTVDCELREAATMEVIATQTFEGNNSFPSTVVWGTSTTSDEINSKIVEDWLQPYVNP